MKKLNGFGLVPASIMRCKDLSIGAKALYALSSTYADKKRVCFPNRNTICEGLGITPHTFSKYLKQLEAVGAVEVMQQRNNGSWGSNYYCLKDTITVCQNTACGKIIYRVSKSDTPPCVKNQHTNNTIYNNTIRTYKQPSQNGNMIYGSNNYEIAYK